MYKYLKLLRVKHYIKNFLIFCPAFFGRTFFYGNAILECGIAFLTFSFLSSIVYIINDIHDLEKDRLHPEKSKRPIASGAVSQKQAWTVALILGGLVVLLQVFTHLLEWQTWLVLIFYFVINMAYSIWGLKGYPLVDVFVLALGFVLRIMFGSVCTGIEVSQWLYLVVFSGSLFMGFGKRRNELLQCQDTTRAVLSKYNKEYLGRCLSACMTLSIVFYSFWCMERDQMYGDKYYLYTVPVFVFIMLKYSYDIENDEDGDPTNVILNDKILILCVLILAVLFAVLMYLV